MVFEKCDRRTARTLEELVLSANVGCCDVGAREISMWPLCGQRREKAGEKGGVGGAAGQRSS